MPPYPPNVDRSRRNPREKSERKQVKEKKTERKDKRKKTLGAAVCVNLDVRFVFWFLLVFKWHLF